MIDSQANHPVATTISPTQVLGQLSNNSKARVIFFRRARHTDSYFSGPCRVSEQTPTALIPVVQIKDNRYASILVEPGIHRYYSKNERSDQLTLELESGETYFVECTMESGWVSSNPDLRPSTEQTFNEYLPNLKPQ